MKLRITALVVCSALSLAACGGASDKVEQGSSNGGAKPSTSKATKTNDAKAAGSLLEVGFGQRGIYVRAVAIVQNTSDKVGQTVTVQFNVKDAVGEILKSESQVETFSRVGQKMPVGVQVDLPEGKKAAKVEATLLVEDKGTFSSEPFPEIMTGPVTLTKSPYGVNEFDAKVEVLNPKAEPLKSPRVEIVCYDAANKIIGGNFTYPELIPPSGKAVVETSPITADQPASCVAYATPGPL
jgi:hypothetical protein